MIDVKGSVYVWNRHNGAILEQLYGVYVCRSGCYDSAAGCSGVYGHRTMKGARQVEVAALDCPHTLSI